MSNVELQGLDKIMDALDDVADGGSYEEAMGKACALVERAAKKNAPKGSGELRRSISSRVENNGEVEGIVFTPLFYAPYVEYGTGLFAENGGRQDVPWHYQDDSGEWHSTCGMKPHPFLRPALEDNLGAIKKILKEGRKKK